MDDFFAGIEQVELKMESGPVKFPIFYREARAFAAVLPANALKLTRILPHPRFSPAHALPGVGAIALIALEYRDTDIEPYNEFLVGPILNSPYFSPVPGYNLLRQYIAGFYEAYVHHLPVTTEIALRGGIDFYNYPKFLADIDFSDTPDAITCDLSRDGERILSLSGPKVPARDMGEIKFMCNMYQYRQPQSAEFKVNAVQGAVKWMPAGVSWSFNTATDIGRELSEVVLGARALMYFYLPKIQCILYGPENMSMPLLQRTVLSEGFMPKAAAPRPAAKKKSPRKPAAKKNTGEPA